MKSQAVFPEAAGIRGESGELNASGPPIDGGLAKLPGDVPAARLDGLALLSGSR
jgi:hypothetical protein